MSALELFSETKLFISNCLLNTSIWMPSRHSKLSMSQTEPLIPPATSQRNLHLLWSSLAQEMASSSFIFLYVTNLELLSLVYFKLYLIKTYQWYLQRVSLTRPKLEIRVCPMAHPFHAAVLVRDPSVVTLTCVTARPSIALPGCLSQA